MGINESIAFALIVIAVLIIYKLWKDAHIKLNPDDYIKKVD